MICWFSTFSLSGQCCEIIKWYIIECQLTLRVLIYGQCKQIKSGLCFTAVRQYKPTGLACRQRALRLGFALVFATLTLTLVSSIVK